MSIVRFSALSARPCIDARFEETGQTIEEIEVKIVNTLTFLSPKANWKYEFTLRREVYGSAWTADVTAWVRAV